MDQEYVISESSTIAIEYEAENFFTTTAVVDCGAVTIEFIKDGSNDIYTETEPDIFTDIK